MSVSAAMFLGDTVCQQIEQSAVGRLGASKAAGLTAPSDTLLVLDQDRHWNINRSMRMGFTGLVVSGPISQCTYLWAARCLPHFTVPGRIAAILSVAPINITTTMASSSLLAGQTPVQVIDKCSRDVPATLAANTLLWPGALWFVTTKVSVVNQAVVGSGFWFVWSIVLSMYDNRG